MRVPRDCKVSRITVERDGFRSGMEENMAEGFGVSWNLHIHQLLLSSSELSLAHSKVHPGKLMLVRSRRTSRFG